MCKVWLLIICAGIIGSIQADAQEVDSEKVKIDKIIDACRAINSKDKICEALVTLKQIGDDSIEAVKEYADLSPRGYAILTAMNALISQRIRIRSRSFLIERANHTYDIQKDKYEFLFEMEF